MQSAPRVAALKMTTTGSAASRPQGNRSSGPRRTKRKANTARPERPMLANEYNPSKTIMLEPLRIPQMLENTANPAEAQTENSSSRLTRAVSPEDTEQDIATRPEPVQGRSVGFDELSPHRGQPMSSGSVFP